MLERREGSPNFPCRWQRSAAGETIQVCRPRMKSSGCRELPREGIRRVILNLHGLNQGPQLEELDDRVDRQSADDITNPGVTVEAPPGPSYGELCLGELA
jgi:hypothetical protein